MLYSLFYYFGLCTIVYIILYFVTFISFFYNLLISILLFGFLFYLSNSIANLIWNDFVRQFDYSFIEKVNPKNKSVLITGCDTGFGNKLAYKLIDYGFTVFASCLDPECQGAKQLKNYGKSNRVFIVKLDVTKQNDVDQAVEFVTTKLNQINSELFALVNNAGIMISTEIEFGGVDIYESQMNVNCFGAIRVTKAFLGLLRKTSLINQEIIKKSKKNSDKIKTVNPRIINVCSIAGRFAIPGINSYCVSKAALINFTSGLRIELIKWGIDVVSIEPHLFKTNLVNAQNQHYALDKALEKTNQEILTSYGEQYIKEYKVFLDTMLSSARDSVNKVVNTLFIATTDQFVSNSYKVVENNLERIRLSIYQFIPERLLDLIAFYTLRYKIGKPAIYNQENKN